VWAASAALIVAFMVAFSRSDLEMVMWGGYPNVIALLLIPLAFYVFLQRAKFSLPSFLLVASFLAGAIFLTHSLSAIIFVAIAFSAVLVVTLFSKRFTVRRTHMLLWLLPIVLGAIIIAPFLAAAAPLYLGANTGTFTGVVSDVRLALAATQTITVGFLFPLIFAVFLFFVLTRIRHGRFLTVSVLLLSLWILIPAVGAQGYIFGFYTDYNRFTYYVYLPVIILFGLVIDYASGFLAKAIHTGISKLERWPRLGEKTQRGLLHFRRHFTRKILYVIFSLAFILYCLFPVAIFAAPLEGIKMQMFYQVMDNPLNDAVQWARNNTPSDAVFATDAVFGWWFAGFAQRPTLSANEPQTLILSREFEPAENTRNLLDTAFVLDNGLFQVRDDGGYIGRHNPLFLAKLNDTYFPEGFFHFNDDELTVEFRVGEDLRDSSVSELSVKEMRLETTSSSAAIVVTKGNEFFNFTRTTTVYQGVRFANLSITLDTSVPDVHLDRAIFLLHMKYADRYEGENTIGLIERLPRAGGQLIFTAPVEKPQIEIHTPENPSSMQLTYNLNGNSSGRIELFAGVFQIPYKFLDEKIQAEYNLDLVLNNTKTYADKTADLPVDVFNYREFLKNSKISYILCRDSEAVDRFVDDPQFSIVFANKEVTIFKVHKDVG
jgi:hypothetical protein